LHLSSEKFEAVVSQWLCGLYGMSAKGMKDIYAEIEQLHSKYHVNGYLLELTDMIK
jgi:hypothetical protein